jgi:hypothetical protein
VSARHAGYQEAVQADDIEAAVCDELVDASCEMASAAERLLKRVEPPLPLRDAWFVAEAVLEEQERSSGLEHAPHLAHRSVDVRYRAHREGADGAIEPVVFEGQAFGAELRALDGEARHGDTLGDSLRHQVFGIDHGEFRYTVRIARKVQAGAEAEFEHFATRVLEGGRPLGRDHLRAHTPVEEAPEDPVGETHASLVSDSQRVGNRTKARRPLSTREAARVGIQEKLAGEDASEPDH